MHIYHNSQNTYYRAPFGAVQVTTSVTLSIDVADVSANTDIFLEYYINGSRQEIRMELTNPASAGITSGSNAKKAPSSTATTAGVSEAKERSRLKTPYRIR